MTNSPPDDRLTALETAFADYRIENDRKLDRLQLSSPYSSADVAGSPGAV